VSRGWRLQLALLAALALAVRVSYVLRYKHPMGIGGDAYWYHYGANLLVGGHGFIDAYHYRLQGRVVQTADHPPGTILVLAAASLMGMRSFFWHQLEMCVLGSITVVVIAVTARLVGGRRAGIIAGLIAAAYPFLWLNDALVMSETLVQLTTALAVLAAYRWWVKSTRGRAAVLGAAIAACALTRAEAVLYAGLLVVPLVLFDRRHVLGERVKQALVSVGVAAVIVAPWVGYNLYRFEQPVTISTGFDPTAAVSNCDATYYGKYLGYWWLPCIRNLPVPTKGDLSTQEAQYRKAALKYLRAHAGRLPVVVAARVTRAWGVFRPVQQIELDQIEAHELSFSRVGLAMYYALVGGTVVSVWLLRRRRVPISPILATVGVVTIAVALTFGQTRYRASAEVVLVLGGAVALAAILDKVLGPERDPGFAFLRDGRR
jgi:4-amino-4-deoxy-L-arabinose transferase-like glycosyltransferase